MTSGRRARKSARRRKADDVAGINRTDVLTVPNMITILRCFDNVLICLRMSLVFLSLPQRQHKMQVLRKIKNRKQSIDAQFI